MCLQPGSNSRIRCSECGLSVSARFGVHPTCRPAARAAAGLPREPNVGDTLPSFDAILLGRTRTLRHLPGAARYLWTKVLTRALAAVRLGKNCSCYPRRCLMLLGSGRKHAKAAAAYTLDRLQRWESGERRDLWDSRQPPLAPGGRARTLAQKKGLATSLAREGFDNKACAALLAEGLCKETLRPWPASKACTLLRLTHWVRRCKTFHLDMNLSRTWWPKLCAASRLPQLPALPAYLTMWTRSCNSSL